MPDWLECMRISIVPGATPGRAKRAGGVAAFAAAFKGTCGAPLDSAGAATAAAICDRAAAAATDLVAPKYLSSKGPMCANSCELMLEFLSRGVKLSLVCQLSISSTQCQVKHQE